jgi:hypothetical protein
MTGIIRMCSSVPAIVLALLSTAGLPRTVAQTDVDRLLQHAATSRRQYSDTFKDLTAVETRTSEVLNKDGTIDKRRMVIADFYVYPLRFRSGAVYEYRITRQVDGKAAGNPTDEAMKLFRALAKAKTVEQEIDAINEQNFRHVVRFVMLGLAVSSVWPVHPDQQQHFTFAHGGREQLDGRDVVVLTYEAKSFRAPGSRVMLESFKNPRTSSRGRVWLDANDWSFRRWVDDSLVVDDDITTPMVQMHKEADYESSAIGVVPKRIAIEVFVKSNDKKLPLLRPTVRQIFTYEAFKRFDVSAVTEIGKLEKDK